MKKLFSVVCLAVLVALGVVLTANVEAKQFQRSSISGKVSAERLFSKQARSLLTGKRIFNHQVPGFGGEEQPGFRTLAPKVSHPMRSAGPQKIGAVKASLYGICSAFDGLEFQDECFWGSIDVNEGTYAKIYSGSHYYTNDSYFQGGFVRDDVLYISTFTQDLFTQAVNIIYNAVDLKTGKLLNPVSFGADFLAFAYAMTYDFDEDVVYAMCLDASYIPNTFVKINPNTWEVTKIGTITWDQNKGTFIAGLAYNPVDKKIYAIRPAGDLVTIDKTNAKVTSIGPLDDCTPFDGYAQPIVYSPNDHGFITMIRDAATGVGLTYFIDPETAEPSYLCSFEDGAAFQVLYCPDPYAVDDAPAIPIIESVNLDKASLDASVTYTIPTLTFNGEAISESSLNVDITIDGKVIASTTAAPGETKTTEFTSTEGNHRICVVTYYDREKPSPVASKDFFLGNDTPFAPANVRLENSVVYWDAVGGVGVNGGYVDIDAVRYNVYINGELRNSTPINETSLVVDLGNELSAFVASVEAVANGKKSALSTSENVVHGDPLTLPVSLAPTLAESLIFTNDDTNHDGNIWTYYPDSDANGNTDVTNGEWVFFYNWAANADDWLFMPVTTYADADAVYELSYNFQNFYNYANEFNDMDVCIGGADSPEAMTSVIYQVINRTTPNPETHRVQFTVPQAGNYYIGFHIKENANGSGVRLRDFKVEKISDGTVPAPAQISVVPAEKGALKAIFTISAPTKDVAGNALSSSDEITYTIASAEETVECKVMPGATVTAEVVTFQGVNQISVTPTNKNGRGVTTYYRLYTGIDIPTYAPNVYAITAEDNESMTLYWDAPTTGENGGFIDPENIYYDIYYHWSIYNDLVGTTKELKFVYDPDPYLERTAMTLRHIGPRAVNSAGQSKTVYFAAETLGTPHELPMIETFAGGGLDYSPWNFVTADDCANSQWDLFGSLESLPVGNADLPDGGSVVVYGISSLATRAEIIIPKVSTKGHEQVTFGMRFWNYAKAPDMKLLGRHFGQDETEVVAEINHNDYPMNEWVDYIITLPEDYANCGWIQMRLSCDVIAAVDAYGIFDEFSIYENLEYDFKIGTITADSETIAGATNQVMATLVNAGTEGATSNIKFSVFADDELVETIEQKVGYLRVGQAKECYLTLTAKPEYIGKDLRIKAEVISDNDMNSFNNSKETEWVVSDTVEPVVTNLTGEWNDAHDQVILSWTTPDLTYGDSDGFESYEQFTYAEKIGSWTNIDEDGGYLFGIDGLSKNWEGYDQPRGWQVINAETLGTMGDVRMCPRTGKQFLMAMSIAYDEASEEPVQAADWLISPEVNGGSEVSFWYGTISSTYSETIEIWYSTTDNNKESFAKLRNFTKTGDESWEYVTYTLPEDAKYFALKYVSWGAFGAMIDDIAYSPVEMLEWEVVKYNVYRDGEFLASVDTPGYVDTTAGDVTHTYNVTVVVKSDNNDAEGILSNTVKMIDSLDVDELAVLTGVYGVEGAIVVDGYAGNNVCIYSTDGKLLRDAVVGSDSVRIPSDAGIYIVKIGEATLKVIVK